MSGVDTVSMAECAISIVMASTGQVGICTDTMSTEKVGKATVGMARGMDTASAAVSFPTTAL